MNREILGHGYHLMNTGEERETEKKDGDADIKSPEEERFTKGVNPSFEECMWIYRTLSVRIRVPWLMLDLSVCSAQQNPWSARSSFGGRPRYSCLVARYTVAMPKERELTATSAKPFRATTLWNSGGW